MARLEANCDVYVYDLFSTKIDTNDELICAVSYTIGRIAERGRTVPQWYEDYGRGLACRLIALYRTDTLNICTMYQPVLRDAMLSFLLAEAEYPSEKVMNEYKLMLLQL